MQTLKFITKDFLPILIFYIVNHFYGTKFALISAIITVILQVIFFRIKKIKISNFFKFSAIITIIFSICDLYLQKTLLFKYESALTNAFTGIYFACSLRNKETIIAKFAKPWMTENLDGYFRKLTIVWSIYFLVKAIIYAIIAHHYALEKLLILRLIFGKISFWILLFISIYGRRILKFISCK
ncbi:septation protein IspZ [Candidatus Deianiraea vastatrix]|uniref:Intracellular septation protein A n=1 Tax=Candidatus Deianiraea vastatrix TaxID=2163644 RepID=A0A5B8XFN9_9RICK|nr:septation protein IspZ [Candidatus Deianiraea vastatrix]QED23101.1 Putative intracellular septation protein A [Candidatus Deianiraea vastatrix]